MVLKKILWGFDDWKKVFFNDGIVFCVSYGDQCVRAWWLKQEILQHLIRRGCYCAERIVTHFLFKNAFFLLLNVSVVASFTRKYTIVNINKIWNGKKFHVLILFRFVQSEQEEYNKCCTKWSEKWYGFEWSPMVVEGYVSLTKWLTLKYIKRL